MGKVFGPIIALLGVILLFNFLPTATDATHDLQIDLDVQVEAAVTTGAAELTADVVLDEELWKDRTTAVTSITSDNGSDTPVADSYVAATQTLTVSGLVESDTRELTITYEYDALTDYTMMGLLVSWAPVLLLIGIMGLIGGALWSAVSFRGS